MPGKIVVAAARWQRHSSDANRLCCAISAKSAEIPPAIRADLIPTDSAVRVRPPQPRSRSRRRDNSEFVAATQSVYPPALSCPVPKTRPGGRDSSYRLARSDRPIGMNQRGDCGAPRCRRVARPLQQDRYKDLRKLSRSCFSFVLNAL
jgi:hypothetical protein